MMSLWAIAKMQKSANRTSRMGIEATCVGLAPAFCGPATPAEGAPMLLPMSLCATGIDFDVSNHVMLFIMYPYPE
jgi:hypothetical protein